jgi:hypothetical protein
MHCSLARKPPSSKACFGHEIGLSEFCERGEGLARSLRGGDTDGATQVVSTTACERGFLLGESRFLFTCCPPLQVRASIAGLIFHRPHSFEVVAR